jgi:hypothetical protein
MAFIRFVLAKRHPESGFHDGVFRVAYQLCDDTDVSDADRRSLRELIDWFEKKLATPDRFNRSRSKGYYRRATRGIAWLRDTATDCASKMHQLRSILETNGYQVRMIRANRVGFIVYEDEHQVVAEPFADTRTGPE